MKEIYSKLKKDNQAIIVLHEIYGVNQFVKELCQYPRFWLRCLLSQRLCSTIYSDQKMLCTHSILSELASWRHEKGLSPIKQYTAPALVVLVKSFYATSAANFLRMASRDKEKSLYPMLRHEIRRYAA